MLEQAKMWRIAGMILLAGLSACASKAPAPVESRTPAASPAVADAPAVARPGYHIVKKGDTLYSIAYQNQRDYRELAAWNALPDPNLIEVGQELRVIPPVESEGVRAVTPAPTLELRPVPAPAAIGSGSAASASSASVSSSAAAPVASGGVKTEPKGGRIVYSAQAWKDLTQPVDKAPVAAASAPSAKPAAQSQPEDSKASASAEGVEWSWPAAGKVIGSFNDASNKGVDIAGNIGDAVLAAGAGEVKYVGSSLRGYGNLVIIKHDNTFLSAYAHNQEILVKEGQQVKKGQKIATLGNSDADRPKLHFEIRRQGKPVDPLKYLPSR